MRARTEEGAGGGRLWHAARAASLVPPASPPSPARSAQGRDFDDLPRLFAPTPPHPLPAFGGWASFVLQRPWLKPYLAHLFHPFRWYQGINATWEAENHARMMGEEHECVIPTTAHICLMHGRNDPVLNMPYLRKFAGHLRARTRATVSEVVFPRARHSMAIVEYPEAYKSAHIEHFLANVPEFRASDES